jgi:hypothetical protein
LQNHSKPTPNKTRAKKLATPAAIAVVIMFDFPLALLELAGVVVADVVTAPELPELIVEVALEVKKVRMDDVVGLDEWAVSAVSEPDVMGLAAGDETPVVVVDPVIAYDKTSKESGVL